MVDEIDPAYGLVQREKMTKLEVTKLLIAFWILGICNHIGCFIILSAALDVLADFSGKTKQFKRDCIDVGTGTILLSNTLPIILAKFVAAFLPLMIQIRFVLIVSLTILGYLLSAFGTETDYAEWFIIIGVILISFSCGFGESTLLAYTVFFSTINAISTWASGIGAAGVIGTVLYSILKEANVSRRDSLLIMLIWPVLMASAFWGLVKHPRIKNPKERLSVLETSTKDQVKTKIPIVDEVHTILGKLKIFYKILFPFIVPFSLTFLFQHFINQALFEALNYPQDVFSNESQYRWYQTTYHVGVFTAQSSMNIIPVNNIWILASLQGLNALILTLEVCFGFLYFVLICICFILWEGVVAGAVYVNTYRRILEEVPPLQREFSMAINSLGNSIMIILAGMIAIPVHTTLCNIENPYETDTQTNKAIPLPKNDSRIVDNE